MIIMKFMPKIEVETIIKKTLIIYLFSLILGFFSLSFAANQKILPANEAFSPVITKVENNKIKIKIGIPDGYYIYKDRSLEVKAVNSDFTIDKITLSDGYLKNDKFFGEQEVWNGGEQDAEIVVFYQNPQNIINTSISLKLQGCIDGLICYPPEVFVLPVTLVQPEPENSKQTQLASLLSSSNKVNSNNLFNSSSLLLPPDTAFAFYIETKSATKFIINWKIADGYYLYRDKISIKENNKTGNSLISKIIIPQGKVYSDSFFKDQQIFRNNQAKAIIYLKQPASNLNFDLEFQGCSDTSVCYPVIYKKIDIDTTIGQSVTQNVATTKSSLKSGENKIVEILLENKLLSILLLFGLGLLLAFTVCVLPMVPILLAITSNQQNLSKARSALLAFVYILGMATMMAIFGLIAASFNINLQIIFQKPIVLIFFSSLFVLMALAMFGFFSISMPSYFQVKVNELQNKIKNTNPLNLFFIGALSALVVGPCIAPPLIAVLAFITTTQNYTLGAIYLFVLGLGMGFPLIFFAVFSTLVPKTGEFSNFISKFLATVILGVAFWLLSRLLPSSLNMFVWGIYLLGLAFVVIKPKYKSKFVKLLKNTIALALVLIGVLWMAGGATGHTNILRPFSKSQISFKYIKNQEELENIIKTSQKPVMLDLYADWCVSCKELENIVFYDEQVVKRLNNFTLLKLDITETNDEHRYLMKKYNLFGPPVLLFFKDSKELENLRVVGLPSTKEFLLTLSNEAFKL